MSTTRREALQQIIALPLLLPVARHKHAVVTAAGPDCLAQESAAGFHAVVNKPHLTVLAGVRNIPPSRAFELRLEVNAGRWLIWESAAFFSTSLQRVGEQEVLRQAFGIPVLAPVHATGLFVHYRWPEAVVTRSFGGAVPVLCPETDVIALSGDTPVAARKRLGSGGIVFLGSMLGPSLRAGEPQAIQIARDMFNLISSHQ